MKIKIVCISGKAQHGKDTAANYIKDFLMEKNHSVLVTHYGDLAKYICKTFFDWNGIKDEDWRNLLQYVDTDIVRSQEPEYWCKFVKGIADMFGMNWEYILIPDCRFPNEIDIWTKDDRYDMLHMRVERPNYNGNLTIQQQKHISETALDKVIPDVTIINNGSLKDLRLVARHLADLYLL